MNLSQYLELVRKYGLELDHLFETAYYDKYPICGWRQYKEKGKWPAKSLITFGGWSPTDWFDKYVGNFEQYFFEHKKEYDKFLEYREILFNYLDKNSKINSKKKDIKKDFVKG